jgi:regulator of protease activity HflC (stomatin/prohibitin superfamily)
MSVKKIVIAVLAVVGIIAFLILNPVVMISAGERGAMLHWGAVTDEIRSEGIHWVMPISSSVKEFKVTTQKVEVTASASSKDLQNVSSVISINYNLDPMKVNKIYQNFRYDVADILITPAIHEALKAATAKYTAEELITKREQIKKDFQVSLSGSLADNGVQITDIFITDFDFSEDFNRAIEAKVKAEQSALEEKNNLAKVKYQAEQRVASAEAEARAITIQAKAVTSQGGKDYVQLKAIEKWDGHLPTSMIPGGTVPFIDLTKSKN